MKLNYILIKIFQETSRSELETFNHLCELERTLQSLALAVPYAGQLLSGNRTNFIDYEGNLTWYYTCTKNFHHFMFLKIKDATNAYLYFI